MHATIAHVPVAHDPAALAGAHGLPQSPQSAVVVSDASQPSAYWPLQSPQPVEQAATWQVVPLHAGVPWATEHMAPHAPQLATLFVIATSQPSTALLLQFAKPDWHAMPHWPAEQDGTPLVESQAFPQPPQLLVLVWVFTSQPLPASVSQSAKPVLQAPSAHVPVVHCAEAFGKLQTLPQVPQFETLLARSTSQPSA